MQKSIMVILAGVLGFGADAFSAEPALLVLGAEDKAVYGEPVSVSVPSVHGYTYEVLLNGQPIPTDITNLVATADYYEISVSRTNILTGAVTNRLVRFIVRGQGRGDTENGLPTWTPYPVVNSSSAELAGAHLDIIVPEAYPADLELPVVVWIKNDENKVLRVNAVLDVGGRTQMQLRRGVGSGFLNSNHAAGRLNLVFRIPGLETNIVLDAEQGIEWTPCAGLLAGEVIWGAGARIAVTNNLTVQQGSRLIINEGAVVRLSGGANITNHGQILISGTSRRPVVFAPEKWSEPWGGFFCDAVGSEMVANGAVFLRSGAGQSGYPGHRHEQPLFFLDNHARVFLTNCAALHLAGQFFHSNDRGVPYAEFTMVRCLIQRCTTGGEFNGCSLRFLESAFIEVPVADGDYGPVADSDYDGFYLNAGVHELRDSLIGWVKDDCIDAGSGGGPANVIVSNCWIEAAYHEGCAWSGGNRVITNEHLVVVNCGQGIECGWSSGDTETPNVFAEDCLVVGNAIGARFGDNYTWNYYGLLRATNCLFIHNYRDVWGMTWNNWLYGVNSRNGSNAMVVEGNILTRPHAHHPNNDSWQPERDAWRLTRWMSTSATAPVGVALVTWTNVFHMTNLLDGVPVGLSSFTTMPVSVECQFEDSDGDMLASIPLSFAPGETLKRVLPTGFDLRGFTQIRLTLANPHNGELTGLTNVVFVGSVLPSEVCLAVTTNLIQAHRLTEGTFLALSSPATVPVALDYVYDSSGVVLQSGTVEFAPFETLQRLFLTNVDWASHTDIRLAVGSPVNAVLVGFTNIVFTNPPPAMYIAIGETQSTLGQLAQGIPIELTRPAPPGVSVDFKITGNRGVITNGTISFPVGAASETISIPESETTTHDIVLLSLSNSQVYPISGQSEVWFVRMLPEPTAQLVTFNSVWRYLDTGGSPGLDWRNLEYDDSSWPVGAAQLGFGDTPRDEATLINRVGTNGQNTITFYFRKEFFVQNPALFTNLHLELLRDDGGVVYLNGAEVFRSPTLPPPPTVITASTLANAKGSSAPPDNTVDKTDVSPGVLRGGTNLLAVEIHQYSSDSSDISFDLALTGQPTPAPQAPVIYSGTFDGRFVVAWSGRDCLLLESTNLNAGTWSIVTNRSPFVVRPSTDERFFKLQRFSP
ncbi:MAG TPA: hypothetical protein PLW35_08220 [Verrucomicrobiota bacterium]|nr:hypothetical protein [Verrucomicrobiota bacterium]